MVRLAIEGRYRSNGSRGTTSRHDSIPRDDWSRGRSRGSHHVRVSTSPNFFYGGAVASPRGTLLLIATSNFRPVRGNPCHCDYRRGTRDRVALIRVCVRVPWSPIFVNDVASGHHVFFRDPCGIPHLGVFPRVAPRHYSTTGGGRGGNDYPYPRTFRRPMTSPMGRRGGSHRERSTCRVVSRVGAGTRVLRVSRGRLRRGVVFRVLPTVVQVLNEGVVSP